MRGLAKLYDSCLIIPARFNPSISFCVRKGHTLPSPTQPILDIIDLSITLPDRADRRYAVDNVSLTVNRGEILCVVGESGSGKSVMTSAVLNDIAKPLKVESGQVIFDGKDVLKLSQNE